MRSRPFACTQGLGAVDAGLLDLGVQRRALGRGDLGAVAEQPQPGGERRAHPQRAPAGRRLAAHRHVVGLEAEPAGGRDRVDGDVAAARAQRVEDELAVVLELAAPAARCRGRACGCSGSCGGRPSRARGTTGPIRLPNWCASRPPIATTRRSRQSSSQRRMLRSGGWSSMRPGAARKRIIWGMLERLLPGVVREAPELDPVEGVAVEPAERHAGPLEARRALGERMRGEAEAAGVADRPRDPAGVEAAVADLLVDAEGQVVVRARAARPPRRRAGARRRTSPPRRAASPRACRGR